MDQIVRRHDARDYYLNKERSLAKEQRTDRKREREGKKGGKVEKNGCTTDRERWLVAPRGSPTTPLLFFLSIIPVS